MNEDADPPLSVRVRSPFFAVLICALAVLIGLALHRGLTASGDLEWLVDVYAMAWWLATFIVLYCIGIWLGSGPLRRLARYFAESG